VHEVRTVGDAIEFDADASAVPGVLDALARQRISTLTVAPASLESLFMRHYSGRA